LDDHISLDENGSCVLERRNIKREFELTPEALEQLHQIFEEADFFALDKEYLPANIGADRIEYIITYQAAGKKHTVRCMDGTVPAALSPVLSSLDQIIADNSQ
jgi:hypothetical protein